MDVGVPLPPLFDAGLSSSGVVLVAALLAISLVLVFVAIALWLTRRHPRLRITGDAGALRPRQVTWPEANQRAEQLLAGLLTAEQLQALKSNGFLAVPSPGYPGRVYHIPGQPGRITVYQSGRPVSKLCIQPREHLPPADHVLLHKLMIEGDEERYLRTANQIAVSGIAGH